MGHETAMPFWVGDRQRIKWLNFWDPADPVSEALAIPLGAKPLGGGFVPTGIENVEVANTAFHDPAGAHTGYLTNPAVAAQIFNEIFRPEVSAVGRRSKRAEIDLLDAVSVYFHHATPGLGPDVELYQNLEWGLRQRDKALRGMQYFEGVLRAHPYVAGYTFSMADITVVGGLIFAGLLQLPIPSDCTALLAWYARMQKRPSVKNRVSMSGPG